MKKFIKLLKFLKLKTRHCEERSACYSEQSEESMYFGFHSGLDPESRNCYNSPQLQLGEEKDQ